MLLYKISKLNPADFCLVKEEEEITEYNRK